MVNLIKQKRSGVIKGCKCVNGSKQCKCLKENESAALPTVSLESLIVTMMVDAYEKRDVVTFDIPGTYLHADLSSKSDEKTFKIDKRFCRYYV